MSGTIRKYDVFFSYNWRDRAAVEAVGQTLRKQGLTVFLDRWYLLPGRPWPEVLEEALNNCQAVSVFLGPYGMGGWQQREKDLALNRQARDSSFSVIPVLLPGADPALGFLSLNTWVDMRAGIDDPLAIAVLDAAARGQPPGPELQEQMNATLTTVCPYRGLRFFREEDAPFFFGRTAFTTKLVEVVALHSMIAVVGASGSGKSSVVRAGLVPYVRQGISDEVWDVATLVPGDRPLHALAAALIPLLEHEMTETDRLVEIRKQADHFAAKNLSLRDVAARVLKKQPGTDRLLLVVDQWEELYTLVHDDQIRERFFDELLEATTPGMLTVVLTLRGDFFGRVLSHRGLADRLQNAIVNLGPMKREELEHAIEAPAQKVGLTFEAGLVGRILDDVEQEPGSLPLLEFVLTGLWERRRVGTLLHEAYEDMGEVRGAMARRADEVFVKLSPDNQELVHRVLVQLVRPGEGTEDTRRRATFTEVGEATRPIVHQLTDARLTVTGRDEASGEQTVEVAHEALISNWARLRSWLDEDREFLLWRQRMRAHLDEWEHAGRERGALLHGALLTEAERWLDERADDVGLSEREFVAKSAALREQERIESEQRRKRIFMGLATGLVTALILTGVAGTQCRRAEKEKRRALAQKLVAQAELMISQQPSLQQRSVLLAVESILRYSSFEVDQTLRHGLALLAQPVTAVEHEGIVRCVVFNPNGKCAATASDPNIVRVWDASTGDKLYEMKHNDTVLSLAFSANGKYLATTNMDCSTRVWDASTGDKLYEMEHNDTVLSLAFSPNGKYLATAGKDDGAQLWDASTGDKLHEMEHKGNVSCVVFSQDGKYVATASTDNSAGVWDASTGLEVARMKHDGDVYSVVFSRPDGKYLATASEDKTAAVWDASTGVKLYELDHEDAVGDVVFSPDGKYLATVCEDRTVCLWYWTTEEKVTCMKHEADVLSLVFSPDGKYLATASDCNTAQVWDAISGDEVARMNHSGIVLSVAFSPDGRYVATASRDNMARVWKAIAGDEMVRIEHNDAVLSVAFSPDGKYVATGSRDNTACVWETTASSETARIGHNDVVLSVAFSPDSRYLITASLDKTTGMWDVDSGENIIRKKHDISLMGLSPDGKYAVATGNPNTVRLVDTNSTKNVINAKHSEFILSVAISRDGQYLATASADCTAGVWNITDGIQTVTMAHKNFVRTVAFSPDSKYVATGSEDNTAAVWDTSTGVKLREMEHEGDVSHVVFSPDGKYLATISKSKVVQVWDLTNPDRETKIQHTANVSCLLFSPDGKHLATASEDGTLRVWDARTGLEVARMKHDGDINSVVFSRPDGKYLATASEDKTARVWIWRENDLIAQARSRLTRNLTNEEWQRYLPDEPYRKTCPNLPDPPSHER